MPLEEFINFYNIGLLSAEELLHTFQVYLEHNAPTQPRQMQEQFGLFNLEAMSDDEVVQQFRFRKEHLPLLRHRLGIPEEVLADRYRISGLTALCILLRRLSYPNRLGDLESRFGMSKSKLSGVCTWMTLFISRRWGHLLEDLGRVAWLNTDKLAAYSQAVTMKGAPLNNVWAFIVGTARKICRPTTDQQVHYSGHKRFHCLKYQSILTPDGIIINLQGPYEGRRHYSGIWTACGVQQQIRRLCTTSERTFVLYGDPAYAISDILITPYPSTNQEPHAVAFNTAMSTVRQAVESSIGKVLAQFAFVDFSKNQKLQLQDLGGMYKVAVLLTNCHTCLYGTQASDFFGIEPPTLEEYLT